MTPVVMGTPHGRSRARPAKASPSCWRSKERRLPIPRPADLIDELERLDRGHVAVELAELVQRNHCAVAAVGTGHAKRMAVAFDAVQVFAAGPVGAAFGKHGVRLEPACAF